MADGRVVIEAILDSANIPKQIKGLQKDLNGITWKNIKEGDDKAKALSGAFKSAGTACTIGLTAPITAAGAAAFKVASDYEGATARIQAAFGVTRQEAEKFKDIGARVYEGGWGESLDEVTSALIQVRSTIRDIDDNGLEKITQTALVLSDTFGADVNETIRGTNALMEGFGLSAEEACDLMTSGMQHGLNYTDELGDNLAEYSVRWGEAGMSATKYFQLLDAGTSEGAYNLDKVGDFLNEFLTSLSDGRMEKNIGRFSKGTREVFDNFKHGKATAEEVLDAVLLDMYEMTNATERASIASDLWSSLGEDNAMGMILALGGVEDAWYDTEGAAQQAADAASDSFGNKMQEATRTLLGSLEGFGEPILNVAKGFASAAKAAGDFLGALPAEAQTAIVAFLGLLAALGPVLSMVGSAIPVFSAVSGAVSQAGGVLKLLGGAVGGLMNPFALVIAVIGALVAAFIYLWNTSEEFRNGVTEALGVIQQAFSDMLAYIQPIFDQIVAAIQQYVLPIIEVFVQAVGSYLVGAFQAAASVVSGAMQAISGIIQTVVGIIQTIIGVFVGVFTGDWSLLSEGVQNIVNGLSQFLQGIFSGISGYLSGIMQGIAGFFSTIWGNISGTVSNVVNGIRGTISGVFNGIKSTVTTVWNGIKSAITTPIEAAKNIVGGIIDTIKGFFGFKISWPHIPMPHFGINPEGWHVGKLLEGVIPSLRIDWYAKGAVFNGASVIGVGEAGPERVQPLSGPIAEAYDEKLADKVASRQSIDWARLEAIIEAVLLRLASQLTIEVDGREFGRVVRRYV